MSNNRITANCVFTLLRKCRFVISRKYKKSWKTRKSTISSKKFKIRNRVHSSICTLLKSRARSFAKTSHTSTIKLYNTGNILIFIYPIISKEDPLKRNCLVRMKYGILYKSVAMAILPSKSLIYSISLLPIP